MKTRSKPSISLIIIALTLVMQAYADVKQPNILFFVADDHGRADCSVFGSKDARTPKMQSLADEGMVFSNAFIASPVCGPSRCALLSGLMPARNGAEGNHVLPKRESQTMVKHLKELGYEVAAIGKVAHGDYGSLCGFDHLNTNKNGLRDSVKKYLSARNSDKPLCLIVGDRRPHVPWTKKNVYDPQKVTLPSYFIDTPETREHWARYLSDITGMDAEMAAVDQLLREHLGSDDYITMYSADHGGQWPFGKWNLYDSGANVALIVRWPGKIKAGQRTDAMVSWVDIFPTFIDLAGGPAPENIDGRSFAGVLLGKTAEHRDVIYTTHTGDKGMNVYPIRAVRTKRFKYIRNLHPEWQHSNHSDIGRKDGAGAYWHSWDEAIKKDPAAAAKLNRYFVRPATEFYDLEKDPAEQVNLAENPEYRLQIEKMSALLDEWMKAQGDKQISGSGTPYLADGPRPFDAVSKRKQSKKKQKKK
ncbi:Choline-sulfatase [Pontiella desulfatans]|uniref:Choline-sulfatase n=1 Tax=Pontiella desulfatans TaxID=2750659 RepID=A0A6C2U147_PONDE|nr:sulfatase [Pontiella desulfatans]SPS73852.1 sulfatase S1_8,S1_22 [Kiritimatiellales bacterium]VGO13615.1 Choline-sulfatase [Pontiella desulfatans]